MDKMVVRKTTVGKVCVDWTTTNRSLVLCLSFSQHPQVVFQLHFDRFFIKLKTFIFSGATFVYKVARKIRKFLGVSNENLCIF